MPQCSGSRRDNERCTNPVKRKGERCSKCKGPVRNANADGRADNLAARDVLRSESSAPALSRQHMMPEHLQKRLIAQGLSTDRDKRPLARYVLDLPDGTQAQWLISEVSQSDPDTMFGLADLGFGHPELGNISLAELGQIEFGSGPQRSVVSRDVEWEAHQSIEAYADEARDAGVILA